MPKETYQIFLSSTSEDLKAYRDKVREMIDKLRLTSIKMETFGAKETMPFKTCMLEVQNCDALIVVVGRRYGWVPGKKEGGDGIKSITWWEVNWALKAKKPVYAFLCDPNAALNLKSEQDNLLDATTDKRFIEIGKAVLSLKKFRSFLESNTTRDTFISVDDLAVKVTSSLHDWIMEIAIQKERSKYLGEKTNIVPPIPFNIPDTKKATRELHNSEQIYWQEQIHLTSARCLLVHDQEIGIALIAGRANLEHAALVNNTAIRQFDVRVNEKKQTPADDYTTALASLLVGNFENGIKYQGILPNEKLSIFQALSIDFSTNADVLAALEAAMVEGNKVVCLPLGSTSFSKVEEMAHKRAAEMGVIIVCPAGNASGSLPHYPAAYQHCISVSATDSNNLLASFSSFGEWVTTAAPGVDIPVAKADNTFDKWSGTSFSCAIVSGVIALMLKANKDLTLEQIKAILKSKGQPVYNLQNNKMQDDLQQINAFEAIQNALKMISKKPAGNTRTKKKN